MDQILDPLAEQGRLERVPLTKPSLVPCLWCLKQGQGACSHGPSKGEQLVGPQYYLPLPKQNEVLERFGEV